jgi:hypothetical protein
MNAQLSPIAETARLETATETLAAYIGYLTNQILAEQDMAKPNAERIKALEHECDFVVSERRAITPDNYDLINRAIYIYAPHLKLMRG